MSAAMLLELPDEEWRPLPGHDDYKVSNRGRVRSFKRRTVRALKLTRTRDGELKFNASTLGVNYPFQVARAVALAWLGPPPEEGTWQARHRNGDLQDNQPSNIYWHKETR